MFFPVLGRILTVILGKCLVKQGWVAVSAVLCNFLDRALREHQKTGSFLQSSDRQIGMGGNADFRFQPSIDVGGGIMELFCQRLRGDGFRCMFGQKMHDRGRQERVGALLFIQGVGKAQKFALDIKRDETDCRAFSETEVTAVQKRFRRSAA